MNKALSLFSFSIALLLAAVVSGAALGQTRQNHPAGPPPQMRQAPPTGRTLTTPARLVSASKQEAKNASGEQFFIVASIDRQNSQLLLKRPTEVTILVKVDPSTKYFADTGKATTLTSFRAGDTVWAKLSGNGPEPTVVQMREGEMTIADLHKYYLDYSIIK